jgi:hypothetical protein
MVRARVIAWRTHVKVLQRDEFFELKLAAWCDGVKVRCAASVMIEACGFVRMVCLRLLKRYRFFIAKGLRRGNNGMKRLTRKRIPAIAPDEGT